MDPTNRLVTPLAAMVVILSVAVLLLLFPKTQKLEEKVWGIQTNTCCSCPTEISFSQVGTDGWVIYEESENYSQFLSEKCKLVVCQPCPPLEEELSSLPDSDLRRGWYWSTEDQKKLGTPDTWVFTEAGRSSCWHDPKKSCNEFPPENNTYSCPESGWVDCMPGLDSGVKYECTSEAINWYRANCPDFKGAAL